MIHIPLFIQILLWIIADLLVGMLVLKTLNTLLHKEKIKLWGIVQIMGFIGISLIWPIISIIMICYKIKNNWSKIWQKLEDIKIEF